MSQSVTTKGQSTQDPRALAHKLKKTKEKQQQQINTRPFSPIFPWEASPKASLEVIFDENIVRMDKLGGLCYTMEAGVSYNIGMTVLGLKLFDL